MHLHHVGHVVRDMGEALALYRRLGFALPPPAYPAAAPHPGAEPRPFGPANTHADFRRNFVELVTHVREGDPVPADAEVVPLQAPAEVLPQLTARIDETSAAIAASLDRFEGLHVLMFSAPDIDADAERLKALHGGVNTVWRPVGTLVETVRYLEFDGPPGEGRVGVVADLDPVVQGNRRLEHPNGAVDLVEVVLCAEDVATVQSRYETYLGSEAREHGPCRVFDLAGARLTIVSDAGLPTLLPGERAPALPALVAYAVAVRDLCATVDVLRGNGFDLKVTASGDFFVPAASALGAAVIFR